MAELTQIRVQVNPIYRPIYEREWRFLYCRGPRNAGRTWAIDQYAALYSMLRRRGTHLFLREFQKNLDDSNKSVLERIIKSAKLESRFHITDDEIVALDTEAVAKFMGVRRNTDSIMSIDDVVFTHFEQSEKFTRGQLGVIVPSVMREPGSQAAFSWNPTWPTDPVESRWANATEDDVCIYSTAADNIYKDEAAYLAAYNDMKINQPEDLMWAYHGEYRTAAANNPFLISKINEAFNREIKHSDDLMIFGGVDVAWTEGPDSDFTAMSVKNEFGRTLAVKKFQSANPVTRRETVREFLKPWNPHMTYVDSTESAGSQLVDELAEDGLVTFGIRFTQAMKQTLVRGMARRLAEGRVSFADPELYDEYVKYGEDKVTGKFGATTGHDDLVTADMLAELNLERHVG